MPIFQHHFNGISPEYAATALLQKHLFPAVKERFPEVPPGLCSESFTPIVADKLMASTGTNDWFSPLRFTALKFNGSVRTMQIPHPAAHAGLVQHIAESWDEIGKHLVSPNSRVVPNLHDDGRLVTMDYGDSYEKSVEESQLSLGAKFRVHADISNCFPSVYTHAIDWAIRGREDCKRNPKKVYWGSELDDLVSRGQDGETSGIPIGPATSNIISELILQQIDSKLAESGYSFVRHVDDYKCYVNSEQSAEGFIIELTSLLYEYRLVLNHKKTRIVKLSDEELDAWISEISLVALSPIVEPIDNIRRLRHLFSLSMKHLESSVLNYALTTFYRQSKDFSDEQITALLPELSRLMWLAPSVASRVVSIADGRVAPDSVEAKQLELALNHTIRKAHYHREVDIVLWCLYGLMRMGLTVDPEILKEAVVWNPLIATLAIHYFPKESISEMASDLQSMPKRNRILLQEMWLLRYQAWREGVLKTGHLSQQHELPYFRVLADNGTTFVRER